MGSLVNLDLKPRFHSGVEVAFSLVPLQSFGQQSEACRLVRGWRLDAVSSHPRCHLGIVNLDGIGNGAVLLGRALLSARLAALPLAVPCSRRASAGRAKVVEAAEAESPETDAELGGQLPLAFRFTALPSAFFTFDRVHSMPATVICDHTS